MTRYANGGGEDFIDVRFDGWVCRYGTTRPGIAQAARLKRLAAAGQGLAISISA
ncbi:MAG: hypothetical protein K2P94_02920 [Rhodospirillaceae bacterium]|nr:hypothetical protein [Rhodospirillaceae bacterium]